MSMISIRYEDRVARFVEREQTSALCVVNIFLLLDEGKEWKLIKIPHKRCSCCSQRDVTATITKTLVWNVFVKRYFDMKMEKLGHFIDALRWKFIGMRKSFKIQ